MKRKLSMLLAIILVATSFIGCDETTQQEVTSTAPSQDTTDSSTEGQWTSVPDDYTIVIDEDNEFFLQEEYPLNGENSWDSLSDYSSVVVQETETPPATETPAGTSIPQGTETSSIPMIQTSSIPIAEETTKIPESVAIVDPDELPKVPETIAVIDPEELPKVPESIAVIDPDAPILTPDFYNGRELASLYSYDVDNYTMARFNVGLITEESQIIKSIVNELNDYTSLQISSKGYFIRTIDPDTNEFHRDYVFIDDSNKVLVDGLSNLQSSKLYPSWLIHMNTDNIVNIELTDYNGERATLTGGQLNILVQALTSKLSVVKTVSAGNPGDGHNFIVPNTAHTAPEARIKINFTNGVYYDLLLSDYIFRIYTSDLNSSILYTIDEAVTEELRRYINL